MNCLSMVGVSMNTPTMFIYIPVLRLFRLCVVVTGVIVVSGNQAH
jgi:hypothetical protein